MLALYQRVQVNLAVTSNDSRSTRQWRAQRYTEGCRGCWCWWRPTVAAIWCSSAMALGPASIVPPTVAASNVLVESIPASTVQYTVLTHHVFISMFLYLL